jgi:hypothetical protein
MPVWEQWSEGGVVRSALAVSIPVRPGMRAGVTAVWQGSRLFPEADQAALVSLAGAYLLTVPPGAYNADAGKAPGKAHGIGLTDESE